MADRNLRPRKRLVQSKERHAPFLQKVKESQDRQNSNTSITPVKLHTKPKEDADVVDIIQNPCAVITNCYVVYRYLSTYDFKLLYKEDINNFEKSQFVLEALKLPLGPLNPTDIYFVRWAVGMFAVYWVTFGGVHMDYKTIESLIEPTKKHLTEFVKRKNEAYATITKTALAVQVVIFCTGLMCTYKWGLECVKTSMNLIYNILSADKNGYSYTDRMRIMARTDDENDVLRNVCSVNTHDSNRGDFISYIAPAFLDFAETFPKGADVQVETRQIVDIIAELLPTNLANGIKSTMGEIQQAHLAAFLNVIGASKKIADTTARVLQDVKLKKFAAMLGCKTALEIVEKLGDTILENKYRVFNNNTIEKQVSSDILGRAAYQGLNQTEITELINMRIGVDNVGDNPVYRMALILTNINDGSGYKIGNITVDSYKFERDNDMRKLVFPFLGTACTDLYMIDDLQPDLLLVHIIIQGAVMVLIRNKTARTVYNDLYQWTGIPNKTPDFVTFLIAIVSAIVNSVATSSPVVAARGMIGTGLTNSIATYALACVIRLLSVQLCKSLNIPEKTGNRIFRNILEPNKNATINAYHEVIIAISMLSIQIILVVKELTTTWLEKIDRNAAIALPFVIMAADVMGRNILSGEDLSITDATSQTLSARVPRPLFIRKLHSVSSHYTTRVKTPHFTR